MRLSLIALVLTACTNKAEPSESSTPDDSAALDDSSTDDTGASSQAWQLRSLAYLSVRVCMSEEGADGQREAQEDGEGFVSCRVDAECASGAFPSCRHLSLAANVAEPAAAYPLLHPPSTPEDRNASGFHLRYVPLCEDGSGDHEYGLLGSGEAPTCAEEDWIRCADGTRPRYYTHAGSGDSRDQWVIWAGSGGLALYPHNDAWSRYHAEPGSFGEPRSPASQRSGLEGVFGATAGDSAFLNWNRVYVEKCTPDRWMGRAVREQTSTATPCSAIWDGCVGALEPPLRDESQPYDLYLHGDRIVEAVLSDLADGPSFYQDYGSGSPSERGAVSPLADAEQVLLTCWSNGCNGLHTTLDRRAELIEAIASGVDVRAVFNSFFAASLEGEYAIDETNAGAVSPERSWYDHVREGDSIARNDAGTGGRPMSTYTYEQGSQGAAVPWFGALPDESCLDDHPDQEQLCYDSLHVLANHLNHPFFYNMAQRDLSISDGQLTTASYCESEQRLAMGCDFSGVLLGFQQLLRKQMADLHLEGETERCEADAQGAAPYDRVAIWAPAWDSHASWASNEPMALRLGPNRSNSVSMGQAVLLWVNDLALKPICLEEDDRVHSSASNSALGLPSCVSP